jgi:hypothetical protein
MELPKPPEWHSGYFVFLTKRVKGQQCRMLHDEELRDFMRVLWYC